MDELIFQPDVLFFLGKTFEESGLVSTETLKIIKREYMKIQETKSAMK